MRPRVLSTLLTLILALALGVGAPLRAVALGSHAGLTAMVICSGDETRTVYLDATGNPVDPAEACPRDHCDACLPSASADTSAPAALPAPQDGARALVALPRPDGPDLRRPSLVQARGPPAKDLSA